MYCGAGAGPLTQESCMTGELPITGLSGVYSTGG